MKIRTASACNSIVRSLTRSLEHDFHPCSKRLLIYDAEKLAPLRVFSQFVYKKPPRPKFLFLKMVSNRNILA